MVGQLPKHMLQARTRTDSSLTDLAALSFLFLLVCIRSWVPATSYAHFDSDQAVFGIMAEDLVKGRAFPLFMYGQRYLLSVSVWLCAPFFALFGPSIVTLKGPIFLLNLVVVWLLWRGFRDDKFLSRSGRVLAILPFAIPSVVASTRLIEHAGGNIEPFIFVLAMYRLRARPIWLGLAAGIGFLNREFSLIGLIALIAIDVLGGTWRAIWKDRLKSIGVIVAVAVVFKIAAHFSTSYFGATPTTGRPKLANLWGLLFVQLPTLLGGAPRRLADFNINSALTVGSYVTGALFAIWLVVVAARLLAERRFLRDDFDGLSFYLLLVGLGQLTAFLLFVPGPKDRMLVRYVLLGLLAICGLIGSAWKRTSLRVPTLVFVVFLSAVNLWGNLRLVTEYATNRPQRDLTVLAEYLVQHRVQYAYADYWTSYDASWLTQERVIISPPHGGNDRIDRYREDVERHASEAYRIVSRNGEEACSGPPGSETTCSPVSRWCVCPPPSAR